MAEGVREKEKWRHLQFLPSLEYSHLSPAIQPHSHQGNPYSSLQNHFKQFLFLKLSQNSTPDPKPPVQTSVTSLPTVLHLLLLSVCLHESGSVSYVALQPEHLPQCVTHNRHSITLLSDRFTSYPHFQPEEQLGLRYVPGFHNWADVTKFPAHYRCSVQKQVHKTSQHPMCKSTTPPIWPHRNCSCSAVSGKLTVVSPKSPPSHIKAKWI